jgi:hypothetical protein
VNSAEHLASRPGGWRAISFAAQALKRFRSKRAFERRFDYRADDLIIASFPRSGSTWLRFLLTHLLAHCEEVDFLNVQLSVPVIAKHAVQHGVDFERLPSPRVMRTHAEFYPECPRAVYLLRDGRDVMVSYYHHFRKFQGFTGTFLEFLESARLPSEWDQHIESWIFQNPSLDRVCVIRYEHMLKDTVQELKKIVSFGGLSFVETDLQRAVDECTFDKMKTIEMAKGLGRSDPGKQDIAFIRKGGAGNWRDHFGDAEKAVFKRKYGQALIKTGYESSMLW